MKEYIKKYYRYLIGGIVLVIVFLTLTFFDQEEEQSVFIPNMETAQVEEIKYIYVDIKGEVRNPGVYKLVTGARLFQAISLAGGITNEADDLAINLALTLSDEQVIYIPNINDEFPLFILETEGEQGLININTASLERLDSLPGIGPTTAQSIINYRSDNGAFLSIEDLLNVPGIGEATLSDIRSYITV